MVRTDAIPRWMFCVSDARPDVAPHAGRGGVPGNGSLTLLDGPKGPVGAQCGNPVNRLPHRPDPNRT